MMPHMPEQTPTPREPKIASWYRELNDGRVEITCKSPEYHLRVSAAADEAWKHVALFEEHTGLKVHSDRRPKIVGAPMLGQMTMTDLGVVECQPTAELQSEGNDGKD